MKSIFCSSESTMLNGTVTSIKNPSTKYQQVDKTYKNNKAKKNHTKTRNFLLRSQSLKFFTTVYTGLPQIDYPTVDLLKLNFAVNWNSNRNTFLANAFRWRTSIFYCKGVFFNIKFSKRFCGFLPRRSLPNEDMLEGNSISVLRLLFAVDWVAVGFLLTLGLFQRKPLFVRVRHSI